VRGNYVRVHDAEVDASTFAYSDGFVQGRTRTVARDDGGIVVQVYCAEYTSLQQASESVERQYAVTMANSQPFDLSEDDASSIKAQKAYLAGGMAYLDDGERPVSIVWFQVGRVMCFDIVLGVPGTSGAPRGGAIDSANMVLDRLAAAAAPTPTPIPGGPDIYEIGQKIRYTDGFTITVLQVEDPVVVNGEAVSPRASIVLVGVEVEACAGSPTSGASISPLDFSVALSNNTRADRFYGPQRQPVLDSARLYPGECIRGWVTFERHWEPRPTYVVIDPFGYKSVRVKAR
jgi:hypothetical protein